MNGYPTSRRHPRTLAEAFPAERADWIECPPQRIFRAGNLAMLALAIVAAVLLIMGVI